MTKGDRLDRAEHSDLLKINEWSRFESDAPWEWDGPVCVGVFDDENAPFSSPVVCIGDGGSYGNASMTPARAREVAAAILQAADEAERKSIKWNLRPTGPGVYLHHCGEVEYASPVAVLLHEGRLWTTHGDLEDPALPVIESDEFAAFEKGVWGDTYDEDVADLEDLVRAHVAGEAIESADGTRLRFEEFEGE